MVHISYVAEFQWLFPGIHQWWEKSDFSVSLASLIQFISKAYSTAFQLHSESNYFSLFLQLPPWPRLLSALAWSIIIASELVFVLPIFSPVGSLCPQMPDWSFKNVTWIMLFSAPKPPKASPNIQNTSWTLRSNMISIVLICLPLPRHHTSLLMVPHVYEVSSCLRAIITLPPLPGSFL